MKTDRFSFAFVALVVVAGVVLAFVNPASARHHAAPVSSEQASGR